jgi:ATP-dependent Lon protease
LAFENNIYVAFSHHMQFVGEIITGMTVEKLESIDSFNLVARQRLRITEILENFGMYRLVEAVPIDYLPGRERVCPHAPNADKEEAKLIDATKDLCEKVNKFFSVFSGEIFQKYNSLTAFSDLVAAQLISFLCSVAMNGARLVDRLFDISEQEMFLSELDIKQRNLILQRVIGRIIFTFEEFYSESAGTRIPVKRGGDGAVGPYAEWQERMKKLNLPEEPVEIRAKVDKAVEALKYLQPGHHEYEAVVKYLELVESVPWNKSTEDNLNIKQAGQILENDHAYLEKQKKRILEFLSVKKLKPNYGKQILCFIGPPGTGKTSLGRSIARAMGRKFVRRSLGGMHDESEIKGHRRTYIGALPGQIIQGLIDAGVNNPVFMLDEIDKVGNMTGLHGNPMFALLEALDPEQNFAFRDNCLDLPFDLSKVLFIATGNMVETIHPALLDRVEIVPTEAYTTPEKLHIAQKYLLPIQIDAVGLRPDQIIITPGALKDIARFYTNETGVRQMEREIASLCRQVAVKVAEGNYGPHEIAVDNLSQFLGVRKYLAEQLEGNLPPGVAIGLSVSSLGEGHILYIEAKGCSSRFAGPETKGMLCTGSLRDVMSESALVARTLVAAHFPKSSRADEKGIHLHIPSGAIPKDGPSAGMAIAVALFSLMTGKPVKEKIAFTGEITLRGAVLPVGGIKQKVIGAKVAGVEEIVMPAENEKDLEEVRPDFKSGLTINFVKKIEEVFAIAFGDAILKKKRAKKR